MIIHIIPSLQEIVGTSFGIGKERFCGIEIENYI